MLNFLPAQILGCLAGLLLVINIFLVTHSDGLGCHQITDPPAGGTLAFGPGQSPTAHREAETAKAHRG